MLDSGSQKTTQREGKMIDSQKELMGEIPAHDAIACRAAHAYYQADDKTVKHVHGSHTNFVRFVSKAFGVPVEEIKAHLKCVEDTEQRLAREVRRD
jgi:hypothetical protein